MEKLKILVVDDDVMNRMIICSIFDADHDVIEAGNGQEALERIRSINRRISAILLDYMMPEMDGLELLRILRMSHLVQDCPVFLITAEANSEVTRQAYELGVMDVISKPVVPFIVRRRIESVIELFENRKRLELTVNEQAERLHEFSPFPGAVSAGLKRGEQGLMSDFEFRPPLGEAAEEFTGGDLLFSEGRGEEIVGRIGIGAETFIEEPEMFLCDEAEGMDLISEFACDGIDFVAELLLLFGRQRRKLADLLKIRGEGIGKISAVEIDDGILRSFRNLIFVTAGLLHTSPRPEIYNSDR